MYRIMGGLALALAGAVGFWCCQPHFLPARAAAQLELPPPRPVAPLYLGVSSCTAASCHQRPVDGVQGREYAVWIDKDPHARAYQALHDDRSRQILKNLRGPEAASAWKDTLCLSCHATFPAEEQRASTFTLLDGVGCESCHGPAGGWLTEHYLPAWKQLSDEEKTTWGMVPTKNLVSRARACAECHVGSGDRDVNHDLIAAGHPRLNFENGRFLARYPKHWSGRAEKERYPDFEARAWAVGQAVTAQAALKLLAHRAKTADKDHPWPEFAEYGCFACHHDLKAGQARQFGNRLPGSLPWGTWNLGLLPDLAKHVPGLDLGDTSPLGQLRKSMTDLNPDRKKVAAQADAAAAAFDAWMQKLAAHPYDAAQARTLLGELTAAPTDLDWDRAAQQYLALAALHHALTDLDPRQRDPQLRRSIEELLPTLGLPSGFDSPVEFDPALFRKRLGAVRKQLGP